MREAWTRAPDRPIRFGDPKSPSERGQRGRFSLRVRHNQKTTILDCDIGSEPRDRIDLSRANDPRDR